MNKIMRIVFLSVLIICMLAMPAMANYDSNGWPVETRVNGTVNGGVFHDSIGYTVDPTQTLNTDVPNGTVKYAYLYTGVWGGQGTGWVNVTFNGDYTSNKLGPIHLEEESDSNDNVWCTGAGKYWLWYNVTNLVNTGQINTATTSKINGSIYGYVYGIVLVVVYEGGDDPKQIQYWINDGSDALNAGNSEGTTSFTGTVNTDNIAMANLTMVHLTGYEPICIDCMQFNGNGLDTSCINTNEFDMHTWSVTNYMEASGNDVSFSRGSDGYVNICNAILTVEYAQDLNVTDVLVNPGGTRDSILRVYVNQSNNISAVVQNNGPVDVTGDFDVCFEADGVNIGCATVTGGLSAGANTTVSIDWTPTCANYPVMAGFPAQSLPLTINVTVDCNCSNCPTCQDGSCGTITESDETNNTFSKVIPAIQVYSTYNVIGGVVNNGYKSKNFDCNTTEEPLDQFKYYNLIGGGVEYNVSGAKINPFAPKATDTRVHHIDLPSGATVKDARLYVYWQDQWGNYKTYPTGCLANLSVNFSGTDLMPDTVYQDSKAFGYYQSPKGSSVFNVTSLVSGSGDYTAIVKNIEPIAGINTTLLGEMLVVVYEGADHGYEVQIWMLEGTDYLMAADDTHNSYDFSVSPEEATATVAFGGSINLADVDTARLITVVAQGMSTGSDMLFNGNVIKTDAWGTSPSSEINVENVSVKSNLLSSGNNMGFRDNGTGGMQASNAILIVKEITSLSLTDLNVTDVFVNPGNERYEGIVRVYVNQSNNISAVVQNNGPGNIADNFDVCFEADGVSIGCATVTGGLSAGANTTVSVDWTPTCANYPVMPGFPAQSLPLTINATVDCNCSNCPTCLDGSCGTITETDETNNTFSKVIPAIQVYNTYNVIGGVVNNGYKSKNFDCNTTEEPLDQFKYYNLIGGGVEYNVSGAKINPFAPKATDTRVHHIGLPSGATVKDARLYVYWQDQWGNYKTYPAGCLANLSVNFSGTDLMPDAAYQDSKAFGYYQSPKGSSVFNVTSLVSGSGDYTAIVKNIEPIAGINTTLLGEMLVVVYEGADHGHEVQIWMLEGTDYLMAADDTHGSYDFSVSPEEATATVAFSDGSIDLANDTARLITVVAQGMAPGSDMLFNGNVIKTDAWDTPTEESGEINVEDITVKSNLLASGNNMGFRDNGTSGMQASNAILIVTTLDLNVTDILVNPGDERYEGIVRVYVNESNNISAVVHNNGPGNVAGDFDVCFEADGVKIGCATVTDGLSAGADTTVSIDWTPICADYPVMPGFPPQSLPLTINVTVDCNCSNCPTCPDGSCGTITESDETNNTFSKVIPAMQVYNTYNVIGGVVNNGYKSKNFDCNTTEEPLDQFEYYNLIGGGVEYNVSGAKISTFAPQANDTRIHHIDLPSGATVKDARLYVYWYDKWGNYNTYPTGCLANLSVNFSGTDLMPDAAYQDSKAFGYYQSPKGSSVFNVTSLVSGSGDYTAIVKNIEPIGGNGTTLLGEMLVVVYDSADHGREVQIWMLEGTDYLMAADDTHGSKDFSVSPEEATATVAFSGGSIDLANVDTASLISVVAQGMAPGSDMLFNGNVIKTDAWDTATEAYSGSKINVEDITVKPNLLSSGNNIGFRDNGTTGMQASNAILIVQDIISLPDQSSRSSGGSSSGGGASGELYENIACSETDRQYVYTNSDISYSFELECNIVQFVKFTSLKSAGQVATKVEILKDTSTLVDNPPSDIVYKNLNIWVGNAGWATERNIDDATVVFTVDKSWITENNIDESSIALYRYSDDTWHELVTRKISEDANSLQFEAETPGFSPFAVTGKEFEGEPGGEGIIAEPTVTAEKTSTPIDDEGIPGFSLFAGLSILLIAVQLLRKK